MSFLLIHLAQTRFSLERRRRSRSAFDIISRPETELKIKDSYTTRDLRDELKLKREDVNFEDVHPLIASMRMVKSAAEINLMREAIKTTDLGIKNILLNLRPGLYEYNVRNTFEYAIGEDNAASPLIRLSPVGKTPSSSTILFLAIAQ
jgi:Xaa-Pro aminopeptidase